MSIASEIARISTDRNDIRTKFVELGIAQSNATLTDLAAAAENIENRGSVSATVKEGETYTIPRGYHNGSGTVSGVAGGGNYSLQSKTVTPTTKDQAITSDDGYYGLSDVTVKAIPTNFKDVSSVTAVAGDVLAGKIFVSSEGVVTEGNIPSKGALAATLNPLSASSYTLAKGYYTGGSVSLTNDLENALKEI